MLFKHSEPAKESVTTEPAVADFSVEPPKPVVPQKDVSPLALRELMEKNLKWSQIIYEQNRKINSKLFWMAFATWFRWLVILVTLIVSAWLLQPIVMNLYNQYNSIINEVNNPLGALKSNTSSEDLCKLLPANLQESCKSITNKK